MRAIIRDAETLRTLRPLELLAYLRSTGWRAAESPTSRASVWNREDFEVDVPLSDQLKDFALRMSEVMATLSVAENRSQLEILRDLAEASADIVRVRALCTEYADGSVPISRGVDLIAHAKDMMMAAACAAVRHQAYFPTRKPVAAVDYMSRLRMGQTERGSFVATIVSRVPPILTGPESGRLFPDTDDPFERRVVATLARALESAQCAAIEAASTGSSEPFFEAVRCGVTANLCSALAGMSDCVSADEEIVLDVSWSRNRPMREDVASRVVFSGDTMPVIEEAARILRENSPLEQFELHGMVVGAHREPNSEIGDVSVLTFMDDRPRRIKIRLQPGPYGEALDAHENRKPVVCYGRLTREGAISTLEQPYGFGIEEEDDSGEESQGLGTDLRAAGE
jgi:hypothetical protein